MNPALSFFSQVNRNLTVYLYIISIFSCFFVLFIILF